MSSVSSRSRSGERNASTLFDRQNALWRGLPAALIAFMGLGALVFAADRNSKLEQRYQRWAEDATRRRDDLSTKIMNEIRILQSAQPNKSPNELLPPTDKMRVEYDLVTKNQRLYYEKLIALNPNEPDYKYHFADACVNSKSNSDHQRGLSLMQNLAPHNQTGFYKAHLWWTDYFWGLMQVGKLNPQVGAELIFNHADNCLKRQSGEKRALARKADSSMILGRNEDALGAYSQLFASDPFQYLNMVTVNGRLNRTQANRDIYLSAKSRIEAKLGSEMSVDLWCRHWEALMDCEKGLGELVNAQARLRREIESQSQKKNSYNVVFLQQLLAKILVETYRKQSVNSAAYSQSDLELISEAYRLDSKNPDVLQVLTRIAMSDSAVAEAARKVYDPEKDSDASPLVLNELGSVALAKQDYQKAIEYMEKARAKNSNDLTTLNNLAYVYLVAENRNPERALKLVDEAIRRIPNPEVAKNVTTFFLDTKATALMQLNRMPEAIAAYEMALKDRPDNVKILENLIKCYESSNLSATAYKDRLKKLTEQ